MIVVLAGPPSSGKSTLGELLAEKRNLIHLEMDSFRARLLPDAAHTREDRQVAYRAMHYTAELLVERRQGVIVNAGYGHAEDRREVEEIAARQRCPLFLIEFTVPEEIAVERCRQRRASHPGLDLTDKRVVELIRNFPYFGGGLTISGAGEIADGLRQAEAYLDAGSPLAPGLWTASVKETIRPPET